MASLWEMATGIFDEIAEYLLEGSDMNVKIAQHGLDKPWGLGVGYCINKIDSNYLLYRIKAYAGAAADVRMGGGPYPRARNEQLWERESWNHRYSATNALCQSQ